MKLFRKLGSSGFSHLELAIIITVIVIIGGIYLITYGHADPKNSLTSTVQTRSLPVKDKTNWSGYVANSAKQFNSLQFSLIVPNVKCLVNNSNVSIWGGIDGITTSTVEQSGISVNCNYKHKKLVPSYFAWTDMYPAYQNPINLPIHPLDKLIFHTYVTASGKFDFYINNKTTAKIFNTQYACFQNGGHPCRRIGAEWIIERNIFCQNPSCTTYELLPLTDYGTVNISNAYATAQNGKSTALGRYQNIPIFMTSYNRTRILSKVNHPLSIQATGFRASWVASQ